MKLHREVHKPHPTLAKRKKFQQKRANMTPKMERKCAPDRSKLRPDGSQRGPGGPQEGHPEGNEAEKNTDGVKQSWSSISVAPFWSKKWPTWAQLAPQDGPQIGQKSIKNRSKNRLKF